MARAAGVVRCVCWGAGWLLAVWVAAGWAGAAGAAGEPNGAAGAKVGAGRAGEGSAGPARGGAELERQKEILWAMLPAAIAILCLFFMWAVLFTMLRTWRRLRGLAEDRAKPTEVVDAWVRYRLPEGFDKAWREESGGPDEPKG